MIFRATTCFSALCFAFVTLLFATSLWWQPTLEIELSDTHGLGASTQFGRVTISEIEKASSDAPAEVLGPAGTGEVNAQWANDIDQKVRSGEIELASIEPMPGYYFLLFDARDYDQELLAVMGLKSWRWVQIPLWFLMILTGLLPAIWLYKRRGAKPLHSAANDSR